MFFFEAEAKEAKARKYAGPGSQSHKRPNGG